MKYIALAILIGILLAYDYYKLAFRGTGDPIAAMFAIIATIELLILCAKSN